MANVETKEITIYFATGETKVVTAEFVCEVFHGKFRFFGFWDWLPGMSERAIFIIEETSGAEILCAIDLRTAIQQLNIKFSRMTEFELGMRVWDALILQSYLKNPLWAALCRSGCLLSIDIFKRFMSYCKENGITFQQNGNPI